MNAKTSLKKLTNALLDQNLKTLASKERELLVEILAHISEVDRRKLHLTLAYPSLFEYLTKHIGYSNGSAQRRIDAARLSNDVPELGESLQSGKINLSQVTLLQKAIRQAQTESKIKISKELKNEIINDLKEKTFFESEITINKALNVQVKTQTKASHQQDESVRLEITLTKSQWQKMEQMRLLLSNSLPHGSGSWDQVLEYVADKIILQKSVKKPLTKNNLPKKEMNDDDKIGAKDQIESAIEILEDIKFASKGENEIKPATESTIERNSSTFSASEIENVKPASTVRTPIKRSIQKQILFRDQCCQYVDPATQRQCGSKWKLNLDHIKPVWAQGTNAPENLRVLCANHNRFTYQTQTSTFRV